MGLERDERLIRSSGLSVSVILAIVAMGFLAVAEVAVSPLWALVFASAAAAWAVFGVTEVLLTAERVIEYRPLLARLARRWPRFGHLERSWRRVVDLERVVQAYASGTELVLRDTERRIWRLGCHDKATASALAEAIVQLQRRDFEAHHAEMRARLTARRRTDSVGVSVSRAAHTGPERCVYCHDDLREDEEVTRCDRCDTAHHADCYQVHGGCAVNACGGRARTRV